MLVCGLLLVLCGLAWIADQLMDMGKDTSETHIANYIIRIALFGVLPLVGGFILAMLHKQMGRNLTKIRSGFIVLGTVWVLWLIVPALGDQGHGMFALYANEDSSSPYYSDLQLSVGHLESPQFVGDEFESYFEIINTGESFQACTMLTCWREDLLDEWISGQSLKVTLEKGESYKDRIDPFSTHETGWASRSHFTHPGTYTYRLYIFDYAYVLEHSENLDPHFGTPPSFKRLDERFPKLTPIKTVTASVVVYERD